MEEALNKSLDDLIKEQRQKKERKSAPRKPKSAKNAPKVASGGVGGGAGKGKRRSSAGTAAAPPKNISITVKGTGGGFARRGGRGGRGGDRRAPRVIDVERQNPELRRAKLEGDAKWGHDMYVKIEGNRGPRGRPDPRAPTTLGTKLFVSNLHFNVTNEDIKELFETCGELAKFGINFDSSDRSDGTAAIIFKQRSDAERALRRYNNVQLDGQPMQIELIEQAAPGDLPVGGRALKSGIRITGGPATGGSRLFNQATHEASRVRGRGNIRSTVVVDRMQE